MARKQHSTEEVLFSLRRKNDVKAFPENQVLEILKDEVWDKEKQMNVPNPIKKWDLGNGSWGKIDYLTKHKDWIIINVAKFTSTRR